MSLTTVIVRWTGPLSLDEVCEFEGNGLYLLTGKQRYERQEQIQYCGITERRFCERINSMHPKLPLIREDSFSVWLGHIEYPRLFKRRHLEHAEHCFVSFWQPALNDKKRVWNPELPICFISQWFYRDGRPRRNRPSIIRDLPDVLWWDTDRWRTGQLRVDAPAE